MTRVWLTPSLSAAATAPLPTQFLALDPIFQTCSDLEACDGWLADQVPSTGAVTSLERGGPPWIGWDTGLQDPTRTATARI